MIARIGRSGSGAALIQNRPRKPTPCLTNPMTVTAMNTAIASTAVTAMWLVAVNAAGISPRKLDTTMNMNSVMIYGKYFRPSLPGDVLDHLVNEPVDQFGDRLGARWHHRSWMCPAPAAR